MLSNSPIVWDPVILSRETTSQISGDVKAKLTEHGPATNIFVFLVESNDVARKLVCVVGKKRSNDIDMKEWIRRGKDGDDNLKMCNAKKGEGCNNKRQKSLHEKWVKN